MEENQSTCTSVNALGRDAMSCVLAHARSLSKDSHSVRLVCKAFRDAFDACVTRLHITSDPHPQQPPPREADLAGCFPQALALDIGPGATTRHICSSAVHLLHFRSLTVQQMSSEVANGLQCMLPRQPAEALEALRLEHRPMEGEQGCCWDGPDGIAFVLQLYFQGARALKRLDLRTGCCGQRPDRCCLGRTLANELCSPDIYSTSLHTLQSLCLHGSGHRGGWRPECAAALVAALHAATHVPGLRELRLSNCELGDSGAIALAGALIGGAHLAALRLLDIQDSSVHEDGSRALLLGVAHLPALQHLSLDLNTVIAISHESTGAHSSRFPSDTQPAGAQQLPGTAGLLAAGLPADSLQALAALSAARPAGATPLRLCVPSLRCVTLRLCEVSRGMASEVGALLAAHSPTLEEISMCFANCREKSTLGDALLPSLADARALRRLDLRGPCCGESGLCAGEALAGLLLNGTALHKLQSLCLRCVSRKPGCAATVLHSLHEAWHIRELAELRLSNCTLSDSGAAALAAALLCGTHLANLRCLELNNARLSDAGACSVADALLHAAHLTALQQLRISHNRIDGNSFAAAVAAALHCGTHLASLQHLNLANNNISDVSELGVALLQGTHLSSLQHLNLADNSLCVDGALALITSLNEGTHLTALQSLHLSYNNFGQPDGAAALREAVRLIPYPEALQVAAKAHVPVPQIAIHY